MKRWSSAMLVILLALSTLATLPTSVDADESPIRSRPPTDAYVGVLYEYQVEVYDPDEPGLRYALDEAPDNMTIDGLTGYVSWTPRLHDLGRHRVTVNVSVDICWVWQAYVLTVTRVPGDRVPAITSGPPAANLSVGEELVYQVVAEDGDVGDVLTFDLLEGPNGSVLHGGLLNWTPKSGDVGEHNFSVRVHDGRGGFAIQNFTVTVVEATVETGGDGDGASHLWPLVATTIILVFAGVACAVLWRGRGTRPPGAR